MTHRGFHVFVNSRRVDIESPRLTGSDLLEKSGFGRPDQWGPEHWDLFKMNGARDPSGGTLVDCDDVLNLEDGDWFRVVQGHDSCK